MDMSRAYSNSQPSHCILIQMFVGFFAILFCAGMFQIHQRKRGIQKEYVDSLAKLRPCQVDGLNFCLCRARWTIRF